MGADSGGGQLSTYFIGPRAPRPYRCFDCGARRSYLLSFALDHWECGDCGGKFPTPDAGGILKVPNTGEWRRFMAEWIDQLREQGDHDG